MSTINIKDTTKDVIPKKVELYACESIIERIANLYVGRTTLLKDSNNKILKIIID